MERKGIGMKYMADNCGGSQSPPRAVELRNVIFYSGELLSITKLNKMSLSMLSYLCMEYR
jgi:hypothetical protein